jgi:hypothetical protein
MKSRFIFLPIPPFALLQKAASFLINAFTISLPLFLLFTGMLTGGRVSALTYYSNGNQDASSLSKWWSNTNGTGTHPANFTSGDIFAIQNGHAMTTSAAWTVAGTGAEISVLDGGSLTASKNVTTTKLTINISGTVNLNSGNTLKINNGTSAIDLLVQGTLINAGIINLNSPAKASFGSGSLYRNARDAGTVPLATWDAGSTCEFTGNTTTEPGGISGQSFGNFTWNCTQTKDIQLDAALATVAGNFTVQNTGTKSLILTNTASLTLTIGGDFILSGGTVNFAKGAAAAKALYLGGNYAQTGGTFTNANSVVLSFNFTGIGKTFSVSSGTLTNNNISWTIGSGASLTLLSRLAVATSRNCTVNGNLNCSTLDVYGPGSFTLSSGAALQMGSPYGITSTIPKVGNIQVTGTHSFSTQASYIYSAATGSPVTGDLLPATVDNFSVYTTSSNPLTLTGNSLTVSGILNIGSGCLELGTGKQVTVNGATTLSGANCLILKSNATGTASFINNSNISGTGTVKVERYIPNNWDWHFLSSPVSAEPIWNTTAKNFVPVPPSTNTWTVGTWNWDFYRWAPQGDPDGYMPYPWVNLRDAGGVYNSSSYTSAPYGFGTAIPNFQTGTGYLVAYGPDYGLTTPFFSGSLNTGTLSIPLLVGSGTNSNSQSYVNSFNLIGNPYPSSLDFNAVNTANTSQLSSASYWIMLGDGSWAAYNVSSGGTGGASRFIAPMQGFEVEAAGYGNLSVTNAMRAHDSQAWLKSDETYTNRLSIRIHNDVNKLGDEVIVHFDPSFSPGAGALKMTGLTPEAPNLYTLKENGKFTINQLSSLESGTEVPLSLVPGTTAQYTLDVEGIEGFDSNVPILLTDLVTGSTTDLRKEATYTFAATPGDNPDRFILRFGQVKGLSETGRPELFKIFTSKQNICIWNNSGARNYKVGIYDLRGRLLFQENAAGTESRLEIPMAEGMYVVKVTSEKGNASRKVFVMARTANPR